MRQVFAAVHESVHGHEADVADVVRDLRYWGLDPGLLLAPVFSDRHVQA